MKTKCWIVFSIAFIFHCTYFSQTYSKIDTINYGSFHKYENNALSTVSFGGAGSISRTLLYNNSLNFLGQSIFFNEEFEDLPTFDVKTPIVDAKYITGSANEQLFSIFHTQNINSLMNYAIFYTKQSYDGYYLNQGTNHNFFQSNFSFSSKNQSYTAKLLFKHQRFYHFQNGGISNDSSFTNDQFSSRNRLLLDVNLENAYSRDALNKVSFSQKFNLKSKVDSLKKQFNSSIGLDLNISSRIRTYFDTLNDGFYLFNLIDSLSTRDSITRKTLTSKIYHQFTKQIDSLKSITFNSGIDFDVYSQDNLSIDTNLYNTSAFFDLNLINKNSKFEFKSHYFFSGFRTGDFSISTDFRQKFRHLSMQFHMNYSLITPAFELNNYIGNHGYWNNDFSNQKIINSKAVLKYKGWKLMSQYSDIKDPIYFDYFGVPSQENGISQVIQTSISKEFELKSFQLNTSCFYQYQGGYVIYQLPNWVGVFDLSYSLDAFKSALQLNVGIQGKLFSEYYLMNYRPDFGVFYVSNEQKQANYLFADFYLNAKIKTVNFFFLISHFNAGLMGYNYFSALHYPAADRYFKLGLRWMFLN